MSNPPVLPELNIRLLGAPLFALDSVPIRFARRKSQALLAYLVVTGRAHTREALAAILAPETDDRLARQHLRNALHELMSVLGEWLHVTPQQVALRPAGVLNVDVLSFERELAAVSTTHDVHTLERAITRYAADFMEGFHLRDNTPFEEWLLLERERLRNLLLAALQELVHYRVQHGHLAAAIVAARRLLVLEPCHEPTHLQLMQLLERSGQRDLALAQYDLCRRALADELGALPSAATTALYERLRVPPGIPPHNLPPWLGPFIGRDNELDWLIQRLDNPACRMITVLGLGGSGKTRLALQAAARYLDPTRMQSDHPFPDGIYFVPLTAVEAPVAGSPGITIAHRVATTIGQALGLVFQGPSDPVAQLVKVLSSKRLLLVLDHTEQLQHAAQLIATLLTQAPEIKLLMTSRVRMQLQHEWMLELEGLSTPADTKELENAEASQLFLQVARQTTPALALTDEDRLAVVRICRRVEGLPLALVLAASWTRVVSIVDLANELVGRLDLLAAPTLDIPERQRSLRTVLAWSWQRLTPSTQSVLRRSAVFHGGFDLGAARAVLGVGLLQLYELRDLALITRDATGHYRIHELVRQYADEQLAANSDEATSAYARHAAYFAGRFSATAINPDMPPPVLEAIRLEYANLEAAWNWAVATISGDLIARLGPVLATWLDLNGLFGQGTELFAAALDRLRQSYRQGSTSQSSLARIVGDILVDLARFLYRQGQYSRAKLLLQEARTIADSIGVTELAARAGCYLGQCTFSLGDVATAQRVLTESLMLAGAVEATSLQVDILRALGGVALNTGAYAQASSWIEEALALARTIGGQQRIAAILAESGLIAFHWGAHERAHALQEESLALSRERGDRLAMCQAQINLGRIAKAQGDLTAAEHWFSHGLELARATGALQAIADSLNGLGTVASLQLNFADAQRWHEEEVALMQQQGDPQRTAQALMAFGMTLFVQGRVADCLAPLEQALTIWRDVKNQTKVSTVLNNLAMAAIAQNQLDLAQQRLDECLSIASSIGYASGVGFARSNMGLVALQRGDPATALAYFAQSIAIRHGLREQWTLAYSLAGFAAAMLAKASSSAARWQAAHDAARLSGVVDQLLSSTGARLVNTYAVVYHETLAAARNILGDEALDSARRQGSQAPFDEMLEAILVVDETPAAS